jgi:HK97 family phage portal protein
MAEKRLSDRGIESLYRSYLDSQIEEKSYDIIRDMAQADGGGVWGVEQQALVDTRVLKSLFFSENWVYIVTDLIGMKISNQGMYVYQEEVINGKKVYKQAENHPLQKRIDNPNPYQDYTAYMYCMVVDLILTGNAITWKGISGQQLFLFPSESVQIDFDQKSAIRSYNKVTGSTDDLRILGSYKPEDIIHVKRPNPSSLFWGLSPFIPGRKSVLFNRYSLEYLNNYYQKGALPGLALEMAQDANEGLAIRLLRSFEQAFTGRSNQRRTLLLPKGVTSKQISTSLADQQLREYLETNKEDILALLKVPKHEVGLQAQGSLGSEEYKTALKNFWATTIIPTMGFISGEFTRALKDELGEGYSFQFFLENIDILQEDKLTKATLANAMKATHSVNEIRKELYELEPIEGGDILQGTQQQQNPFFGLSLAPQETKDNKEQVEIVAPIPEVIFNSADQMIKANGDWFENHKRKINAATKEPIKSMTKSMIDLFADQAVEVIKSLDEISKHKALPPTRDDAIMKIVERDVYGFEKKWKKAYAEIFNETLDNGYSLAFDTPMTIEGTEQAQNSSDKIKKEMKAALDTRSSYTFANTSRTTSDRIYQIIKDGFEKSKTGQQIALDITEMFANPDKMMFRADRIARTETLTALSIGSGTAMNEAKKLVPDLKKMWISTEDQRTRGNPGGLYAESDADHWGLHGQVVSSEKKFKDPRNGEELDFPRDPSAGPSSTINCRCTWVILPAKEMSTFTRESEAKPHE